MKKLILLFTLFTSLAIFAKEEKQDNTSQNNEVKLNIGYALLGIPEFSYEKILNDDSSFGASIAFSIDNDNDFNYMLTPYYRFFFGNTCAKGFFIEANAAIFSEKYGSSNETGLGLGFATGAKLLSKNNWVGELYVGLGRTLINENKTSEAYPRVGISIGKRF